MAIVSSKVSSAAGAYVLRFGYRGLGVQLGCRDAQQFSAIWHRPNDRLRLADSPLRARKTRSNMTSEASTVYRGLMDRPSAIDRALELARSGQHRSVAAILRQLGYDERSEVEDHLATPHAKRELILVCGDAWLAAR